MPEESAQREIVEGLWRQGKGVNANDIAGDGRQVYEGGFDDVLAEARRRGYRPGNLEQITHAGAAGCLVLYRDGGRSDWDGVISSREGRDGLTYQLYLRRQDT